jgi:hypothetical protein
MITANIATIPSREKQLIKTIESLINQVDKINVCLNNYDHIPLDHPKVYYVVSDNKLGDAGKFMFLNYYDGYYLTCDDDLIYPETYAKDMINAIDKYGVVTHHGRSFESFPIDSYYRTVSKHKIRCLSENPTLKTVQFGGTGVMGFHTKTIRPNMNIFKRANMADIWMGICCNHFNIKIHALPHNEGYIKYQQVDGTIWDSKHKDDKHETDIVNNYFNNSEY